MSLELLTQASSDICNTTLWERIAGWEVVIVATIIIIGWSFVQVARMYFMAEIAKIGTVIRADFIQNDKHRG